MGCRAALALLLLLTACAHARPAPGTAVAGVPAPGAVALAVSDDAELYRSLGPHPSQLGLVKALGGPVDLALTRTVLLAEPQRVRLLDAGLRQWGELTGFQRVGGVAADPLGRLYVADAGAGAIFRFRADGSSDPDFGERGRLGAAEGLTVRAPAQLAAASDGAVAAYDPQAGEGALCEPGPGPLEQRCHPLSLPVHPGDGALTLLSLGDPELCRLRQLHPEQCPVVPVDESLLPQSVLGEIARRQHLGVVSAGRLGPEAEGRYLLLGARPDGELHTAAVGARLGDVLERGQHEGLDGPVELVAFDPLGTIALGWAAPEGARGAVVAYAVVGGQLRRLVLETPPASPRPACCCLCGWPWAGP